MLSNAYFLAKFRFDTAENEPAQNLQIFAKFSNFADPNPLTLGRSLPPPCSLSSVSSVRATSITKLVVPKNLAVPDKNLKKLRVVVSKYKAG